MGVLQKSKARKIPHLEGHPRTGSVLKKAVIVVVPKFLFFSKLSGQLAHGDHKIHKSPLKIGLFPFQMA